MDLSFLLSKLLPLFVYPTGSGLLLCVLGLVLLAFRWRRTGWVFIFIAVLLLGVAASPITTGYLNRHLERMYASNTAADAPLADVIIVLGGGLEGALAPRVGAELNAYSDRLRFGAQLYRASRAPLIIVTGGTLFPESTLAPEAIEAVDVLAEWGVDRNAIISESMARNTYENGVLTGQIMHEKGLRRALLVTSARHMPRAMAVFRSLGVDVIAQPTDFYVVDDPWPAILTWIPSSEGLFHTEQALKEYLGFFVYRWRGWIDERHNWLPTAPP